MSEYKKKMSEKINLNSSFSPVLPSHIALMIFPWIRGNIDSAHSCGGDPRTHILSDASFFDRNEIFPLADTKNIKTIKRKMHAYQKSERENEKEREADSADARLVR